MWKFLLLKFLPRRLLPLLMLYEIYKFIARNRSQDAARISDERIIDGRAIAVPAREDAIR